MDVCGDRQAWEGGGRDGLTSQSVGGDQPHFFPTGGGVWLAGWTLAA